jgi:hypothetical protein
MVVHDSTLGSPVLQIPLNFTWSGDQIIVGGTAGFKISVNQFFFVVSGAVTLTYKSGVNPLTGPMAFLANGAQVQDFIQLPLTCNDGDPFIINASGSVTLGGTMWYYKAPSIR